MVMQKRPLGRTGLQVSPIALGGSAFTYAHAAQGWDPGTAQGRALALAMLHTALDRGINYFDTAPAYGNGFSETLIGEVMKTRRSECVLASKVWYELDYQGVMSSVHDSLRRLQTDHIDILQIHGRMYTPAEVAHITNGGPLDALLELRAAGKIGHIGITTEEPWTVIPFLANEAMEVFQVAYNFIYQAAARHFLIEAAKVDAGVVAMRTMTSGILQREASYLAPHWTAQELYEVALKFVLSDSRVHSGIVGTRWPHEVEENVRIVQAWIPPVDFAAMPRLTAEVFKVENAESAAQDAKAAPRVPGSPLDAFLHKLDASPQSVMLDEALGVIDAIYEFTPVAFSNGEIHNAAGEAVRSCRLYAFAQLHHLDERQTLTLFGEHYREVLADPQGSAHTTIRTFMRLGRAGVKYSVFPLKARTAAAS